MNTLRFRHLALVAVVLLQGACGGAAAQAQAPTPAPSRDLARLHEYVVPVAPSVADTGFVEVSGTGEIPVTPDEARVSFSVETRAETAAEAASRNAGIMAAVLAALRGGNLPDLELGTRGYNLRPVYSFPTVNGTRKQVVDGYRARNNVVATLGDVDEVGRAIDLAVGAGANGVASLAFVASDTETARVEALKQAVRRATIEARAIAEALGRELGPPLEVRGGAQVPRPRTDVNFETAAARLTPTTPVEAAPQMVRASVTIRFGLGGAR